MDKKSILEILLMFVAGIVLMVFFLAVLYFSLKIGKKQVEELSFDTMRTVCYCNTWRSWPPQTEYLGMVAIILGNN